MFIKKIIYILSLFLINISILYASDHKQLQHNAKTLVGDFFIDNVIELKSLDWRRQAENFCAGTMYDRYGKKVGENGEHFAEICATSKRIDDWASTPWHLDENLHAFPRYLPLKFLQNQDIKEGTMLSFSFIPKAGDKKFNIALTARQLTYRSRELGRFEDALARCHKLCQEGKNIGRTIRYIEPAPSPVSLKNDRALERRNVGHAADACICWIAVCACTALTKGCTIL